MSPLYFTLPPKQGSPADLAALLRDAIAADLGDHNARRVSPACAHLASLRARSLAARGCYTARELAPHEDYLRALAHVLERTRVPPLDGAARAPPAFAWRCAFDPRAAAAAAGLRLDRAAVSFNLAAACGDLSDATLRSCIGARETTAALRESAVLYQRAAGILKALADDDHPLVGDDTDPTPDISQLALLALHSVMLANAQISTYGVARRTPSIGPSACAYVAAAVRDFFTVAARQAAIGPLIDSSVHTRVAKPAAVLADIWASEAALCALDGISDIDMNKRLTRIREATSALARANSALASLDKSDPLTAKIEEEVHTRVADVAERDREIQRQNRDIYRTRECPLDEIPGHVMVKPTPVAPAEDAEQDPKILLFDALGEADLTAVAGQYDALVKSTVSGQQQKVDVAVASLREHLTSAEHALAMAEEAVRSPAPVAAPSPFSTNVSEEDAVATVLSAARRGGLPTLQALQQEVQDIAVLAQDGVRAVMGLLAGDASEDHLIRQEAAAANASIDLQDSAYITEPYREKLQKINKKLEAAKSADEVVRKRLDDDTVYLSGLNGLVLNGSEAKEAARLRDQHRRRESERKKSIVEDLRRHVSAASALLECERGLKEDLQAAPEQCSAEFDASSIYRENVSPDEEIPRLVRSKLEPLLSRVSLFCRQSASCLEQMDSAVTRATAPTDYVNDSTDPMSVVWKNYSAGVKFAEVLHFLQQGKTFWSGEERVIADLREQVEKLITRRKAEISKLRSEFSSRNAPHHLPWVPQSRQSAYPPPPPRAAPRDSHGSHPDPRGRFESVGNPHSSSATALYPPPPPPPPSHAPFYLNSGASRNSPEPTGNQQSNLGPYNQRYDPQQYQQIFGHPPPPPPSTAPHFGSRGQSETPGTSGVSQSSAELPSPTPYADVPREGGHKGGFWGSVNHLLDRRGGSK